MRPLPAIPFRGRKNEPRPVRSPDRFKARRRKKMSNSGKKSALWGA